MELREIWTLNELYRMRVITELYVMHLSTVWLMHSLLCSSNTNVSRPELLSDSCKSVKHQGPAVWCTLPVENTPYSFKSCLVVRLQKAFMYVPEVCRYKALPWELMLCWVSLSFKSVNHPKKSQFTLNLTWEYTLYISSLYSVEP